MSWNEIKKKVRVIFTIYIYIYIYILWITLPYIRWYKKKIPYIKFWAT